MSEFKPYVPTYTYHINLDERGSFDADVRNKNGRTVFRITVEPDCETEEEPLYSELGMRHGRDIEALRKHLVSLKVISDKAVLVLG